MTAFLCSWLRSGVRIRAGVLPIFLLAAAVHECGHLFVIRLSGGTVHALCLTACGAVLRCSLPPSPFSRAAICLAGPAASFALTALANPLGRVPACRARVPCSAVQPAARAPARRRHGAPASRGRAVYTPAERDCGRVRSRPPCGRCPPVEVRFGGWLFLAGLMVAVSFGRAISKNKGINQILDDRLRLPGL